MHLTLTIPIQLKNNLKEHQNRAVRAQPRIKKTAAKGRGGNLRAAQMGKYKQENP